MKLYGAIEHDRVVYQKRLPNDLPLIAQQLSGYREALQGIVVESTYNWYWLVDGLMDQGHRVHRFQLRGVSEGARLYIIYGGRFASLYGQKTPKLPGL